jgi:hypothetical protein
VGCFDVLVVCPNKAVEAALKNLMAKRGLGRVAVRHHGQLVGLNTYEGGSDVVILIRPLPPADAID